MPETLPGSTQLAVPSGNGARSCPDYQQVVRVVPFTVRRRVRWSDCDPGGIVYTPNFLDYAIETVESWFAMVMGLHWSRLAPDRQLGQPFVSCSLDFLKMLACNSDFEMTVEIEALKTSSYVLAVAGSVEGAACFRARLVAAFVALPQARALPIPDDLRARLERYAREQRDSPSFPAPQLP